MHHRSYALFIQTIITKYPTSEGANWDAAINWDKNPIVFFIDNLETYHKYYLKRPGVNHGG